MKEEKKYVKRLKMILSNIWYIVALVAACTTVVMLIVNWSGTLSALGRIISVFMPFILGFLFAYLVYPLVRLINKGISHISPGKGDKAKKAVSILVSYIIVIGFITAVVIFIAPQIKQSIKELVKTVQVGYTYIKQNPNSFLDWLPFVNTVDVMEKLKGNISDIAVNVSDKLFPAIYQFSASVFSILYNVIFGLIISIYMCWEKDKLVISAHRLEIALISDKYSDKVWEKILNCNRIFNGFLLGKVIDSLIIGVITFILMLIFHFPYPVLLSVIVCVTNMIPYFGPIIGAVPGCAIYLFIDPMLAVWFALLILAIQQFDGWILGPYILGDQTGIKPLAVILGITVGGAFFGVMGMFLGVPTVAVLNYLIGGVIDSRIRAKKDKSKAEPDKEKELQG